jgi:hypothetical protein
MTEDIVAPTEFKSLINLMNRKGFLLEDKAYKLLFSMPGVKEIKRNKVIDDEKSRIEIDIFCKINELNLIIDCKRTVYTWLFPRAIERHGSVLLPLIQDTSYALNQKVISHFSYAYSDIAVEISQEGKLIKSNKTDVSISYKDVHDNVRQSLKETEAIFNQAIKNGGPTGLFVPIILTNAKLGIIDYSKDGIDESGNLTNFAELRPANFVVYNFPEVIKIENKKIPLNPLGPWGGENHLKSVFIVNIQHLKEFIDQINKEYSP